jgi:hypothetical protein
MRQQHDPRQNQSRADRPDQVAFRWRQDRSCRGQCADVNGVAGRKGVEGFSRNRHAMEVPENGQAIGPLLVENHLQDMGQKRNRGRREQDVVAVAALSRASGSAVKPPAGGERASQVLVGTPQVRIPATCSTFELV